MGLPMIMHTDDHRKAFAMWTERQKRIMQCAHCGGYAKAGEPCSGCGSRESLWVELSPSVPKVTKRNPPT